MAHPFNPARLNNTQSAFVISCAAFFIFIASMFTTLGLAAHFSQSGPIQDRCLASAMGDLAACE